ncbi:hypothetical protein K439DRAFT_1658657 [Ramaria rubella]|nr:hypothetical protein K439DRAFT_1658657 [Ramaria rubella]
MPASGASTVYISLRLLQKSAILSASILSIYDHVLCFGDEVDQIWNVQQNVVTISFLVTRYTTPIFLLLGFLRLTNAIHSLYPSPSTNPYPKLTYESCHAFDLLRRSTATVIISNLLAHTVMSLRVYALYGAKLLVLLCLLLCLLVETMMMVIAMTVLERYTGPPKSSATPCPFTPSFPKSAILFWASPLVGDTLIFALTLVKTRQYSRSGGSIPILRLLFRDGMIYYGVVSLINVFNLLLILVAPLQFNTVGSSFTQAFATIFACKIVLNLRKESSRSFLINPGTSDNLSSISETPKTNGTRRAVFSSVVAGILTFFEPQTTPPSGSKDGYRDDLELEDVD